MVRVLVIGAGAEAGPWVSILPGGDNSEGIRLGDFNLGIAKKVADKTGRD